MTVPLDICSCLLLSFNWYFSLSLCCKVCPRCYSKWLISLPDTLDRSSEVTIVLGFGQIPTSVLYLSSEDNPISSFVDCARIFSLPQIGHWAWPLFTQLVHMRSDIGPSLFQRSLNTGYNWSPQGVQSSIIEKYFASLIFFIILHLISFANGCINSFCIYVQDNVYGFHHFEYV